MKPIAHSVVLAGGAKRSLIAFTAGAFGALAMPPIGLFPALIVSMSVAVWLLDGCGSKSGPGARLLPSRLRSAAIAGWMLGFGYFVAGMYWLGAAFLVEPDRFAWLLPLGVLGLPAVLACFTALGFVLSLLLWRTGGRRILALAVGLGLSEVARGVLFTGFPWNAFGMAFGQHSYLAQSASIFGLYGLTAVVIAICAVPATLIDEAPARRAWRSPLAIASVAFLTLIGFGALRLSGAGPGVAPNVRLRIMQPNIQQDAKFRPAAGAEILRRYLELSDRSTSPTTAGLANVTHLVWPESAFPFVLGREPQALNMIAGALGRRTILLTGAIRVEGERSNARAFNSLQAVDGEGRILDSADKTHLVPFGEYLPFGDLLRRLGLRQFIALPGGFEAGSIRRTMTVPGLPTFQPLICYEAIFPGEVVSHGAEARRPEFMLNVTNDGWFGLTSGPYQHLAQARLRATEEGLPLVRAANTGVSAVVDAYGRIVKELPLGVEGVLDSELPKPIAATPFSRHPFALPTLLFILLAAGALLPLRRV